MYISLHTRIIANPPITKLLTSSRQEKSMPEHKSETIVHIIHTMMDEFTEALQFNKTRSLDLDRQSTIFENFTDDAFQKILRAIRGNSAIEEVSIGDVFTGLLLPEDFRLFLSTIATLPNLKSLRISTYYHQIDVKELAAIIRPRRESVLSSIVIGDGLSLNCTSDVQILKDSLYQHQSLRTLGLLAIGCSMADTTVPKLNLDELFLSIASIPNLESIDVTFDSLAGAHERLSNDSIRKLLLCQTLEEATLWGTGLDDDHIQAMLPAINRHEKLRFLSLRRNPKISEKGWEAFTKALEGNYTMESIFSDPTRHHNEISFLLRMNKVGRFKVLEKVDATKSDWVELLERVQGDTNAIYYLLQNGPHLFNS